MFAQLHVPYSIFVGDHCECIASRTRFLLFVRPFFSSPPSDQPSAHLLFLQQLMWLYVGFIVAAVVADIVTPR